MRLFAIDQIESHWANKYISHFPQQAPRKLDRYFLPISLTALLPAYYLLIAGFTIALVVAIFERIIDSFHAKYTLNPVNAKFSVPFINFPWNEFRL